MISDATKIAIIKTAPTLSHIELIELVEHECELSQQRTAAEGEDTRKTWVGLSNNEIEMLSDKSESDTWKAIELAEARLKEKNENSNR